jgi:hypothetical protein
MVNFPLLGIPFGKLGYILLIAAFALTMWSGYVYFSGYVKEAGKQQDSGSAQ